MKGNKTIGNTKTSNDKRDVKKAPAIPHSAPSTGYVQMPSELTAENGAKKMLSGEFFERIEVEHPDYCGCGDCDWCLDHPDHPETIIQHIPISWTTIKGIYMKIVERYVT